MAWALAAGCALAPDAGAVEPIPEGAQGALALERLKAFREGAAGPTTPPRVLQVVYFTPADRAPEPGYRKRLEAILEDIRAFYRGEMERDGFGPTTFDFARGGDGHLFIHLAKGQEPDAAYPRSPGAWQADAADAVSRRKIAHDCYAALEADGVDQRPQTVLIFCNLAQWDEKAGTFRHHSPYRGTWDQTGGRCFALDTVIQNVADLRKRTPIVHDAEWGDESLGKFNTLFIGGIAHELGHAFALPHCGERWDEKARGKSLMGLGNHHYREEVRGEGPGAFLTMASAMKLAARPLFSHVEKDSALKPRLETNDMDLSTRLSRPELTGRRGAVRVEGMVKGTPPVYGVIAYFDSLHDGGYSAPTATSVPDAEGRYAIEISDLAPAPDVALRLEYCHVNGAISEQNAIFGVTPEGKVDLSTWQMKRELAPLAKAVTAEDGAAAQAELARLEAANAAAETKTVARSLVASLQPPGSKPTPADVPMNVRQFPLGDARPRLAEVGWLKPAANRIPPNQEVALPFLDAGKIHATGLFAHAPSRYTYDLGGQWQTLRGEAGLHTLQQPYGSVVFVIKVDGHEAFRSPIVRGAKKAAYQVDVTGARTLELAVEDAGDGQSNDWALWLDPTLLRGKGTP